MYFIVSTKTGDTIICSRVVFGGATTTGDILAYLIIDNKPTPVQKMEGTSELDVISIPRSEISHIREVGATDQTLDFLVELISRESLPPEQPILAEVDEFLLKGYV